MGTDKLLVRKRKVNKGRPEYQDAAVCRNDFLAHVDGQTHCLSSRVVAATRLELFKRAGRSMAASHAPPRVLAPALNARPGRWCKSITYYVIRRLKDSILTRRTGSVMYTPARMVGKPALWLVAYSGTRHFAVRDGGVALERCKSIPHATMLCISSHHGARQTAATPHHAS